jgi:hypothetical protein
MAQFGWSAAATMTLHPHTAVNACGFASKAGRLPRLRPLVALYSSIPASPLNLCSLRSS